MTFRPCAEPRLTVSIKAILALAGQLAKAFLRLSGGCGPAGCGAIFAGA
jgi:hypothetical protein